MAASRSRDIPVSCNRDCIAGCPLLAHVEDGELIRITDNPLKAPMMRGCSRGHEMRRVVYAEDRLRTPLLRNGDRGSGQFREVGWDGALDFVAEKLRGITETHGPNSIIRLGGSGACRGAVHNTGSLSRRFLSCCGGYTDTSGSYSFQAGGFALPFMYGQTATGMDPATLQRTKLVILWGANIVDTRFGNETESWLLHVKNAGVPIICIDPRRSRTVEKLATEWIPILPGTDVALMASVLHVLLDEDLIDRRFVDTYSLGFDRLERYILGQDGSPPKTPAWAANQTGVPEGTIVSLARSYGRSKPTALLPGFSIQRTIGGEEATRMAVAMQVATGNVGVPGGSSAGWPMGGLPGPKIGGVRPNLRADQLSVPVCRWPDAILEGKSGGYPADIHAIYNVGGNYVAQGSDIHKNVRAYENVEFSVCHDSFLTPTALHSDVVLPTTSYLEREDIVGVVSNYLFYSGQAIGPVHQSRNDYDILVELADRLGFGQEFSDGRTASQWFDLLLQESAVDDPEEFKRTGIFDGGEHQRIGLANFVADPGEHPLPTPSGKIEIASDKYAATGYPEIPTCRMLRPDSDYPLRMVTPHSRYRTNSQNSNIPWFRDREEQVLWINPKDAENRGIANDQPVLVENGLGRVRVKARVTGDIMKGVVCLLAGVWPKFDSDGTEAAGSPNVLTSTETTEPSHGTRTHSVLVDVAPATKA